LSYASPDWSYAANTYINKLQTLQNKVLRIITKLPRITPVTTLHEQTGMSLKESHFERLTWTLYQKTATSENIQIQALGEYDPTADKHLRPLSLLAK
jgi:hypothetical protein